jgi:hypothetical protein
MEFKEAMRIFNRICKEREMCEGCVLENKCIVLKECDYAEAEAILAKWAAEHPEKTIADDFFEKHPRAKRSDDGTPTPCAEDCGYIDKCIPGEMSCADCWRRPLEEVETRHD